MKAEQSALAQRASCFWGCFAGLLTILFIALKLLGTIGWSWWWVLAPLSIWIVLYPLGPTVAMLVGVIVGSVVRAVRPRQRKGKGGSDEQ